MKNLTSSSSVLPPSGMQPPLRGDGMPILHHLLAYRADPLKFWLETGRMNPVIRVRFGPAITFWVITDAEWMQHILQSKAKSYVRERRLMKINRAKGPELLFNTDKWEEWLWRRRLMQPAFHRKQIARFADTIVAEAQRASAEWHSGTTVELEQTMKRLTMRIIGKSMFSVDLDHDAAGFQESFEISSDYVFQRATALLPIPEWAPTPFNLRVQRATQRRYELLQHIVDQRFQTNEAKDDLLDMLIAARLEEDDARRFNAEQLVGEMSGIVFAGHETTALTMMWLFYLIAQHPTVESRLLAEIDQVLQGRTPTLADLEQMPFGEAVINETLRLYPPVYVTIREADEEDNFGGYHIPKGTSMLLNIRGIQRDPRYWDNPDLYLPDRFLPPHNQDKHKFAFLPFLSGPRKCLGDSFAMMEMRLIVPTILQRYQLRVIADKAPVERPSFVMSAEGGITMQVTKR